MAQNLKQRKALRVRLLKIQNACVNELAMPTNLELTSSRLLSLLSLTSIASADAKQAKELSTHNFFSNHAAIAPELDRIACTDDFFKYMEMSIAPRGKRYFIRSLPVSIMLREFGPST